MKLAIKIIPFSLASLLGLISPSEAVEDTVPEGWVLGTDGTYSHGESGVTCAPTIEKFALQKLDGPAEPNILGICEYSDADGRRGEIRVRRYISGVGETPLAIKNDRVLMGDEGATGLPTGAKLMAAARAGPGPQIEGEPTIRNVYTFAQHGLLIDCAAWEKKSVYAPKDAMLSFSLACMHLQGQ